MTTSFSGGCLCGAITYFGSGPLDDVIGCHCRQCRKTSGHHVAATAVAKDALTISGSPVWYQSSPGVYRGFCGICGSNLFWRDSAQDHISIFAGTLEPGAGVSLARHIHVSDKGDYYDICDGRPQSAGHWIRSEDSEMGA